PVSKQNRQICVPLPIKPTTLSMSTEMMGTYFRPENITDETDERIRNINSVFKNKIDDADYPCLGAKAALNTNHYRLGVYGNMGTPTTTTALGNDLRTYIEDTLTSESNYMSMIAVFTDEVDSELEFEKKLWMQLQELHDSEKAIQDWDPSVSNDPEKEDFSFSFNGHAFFIVGLHPFSSRKARRFNYTAMAFNLHSQFEQLRDADTYEKMKSVIREREVLYDGSINPMLTDFGDGLEAPQYSGRQVDKSWKCPFLHG